MLSNDTIEDIIHQKIKEEEYVIARNLGDYNIDEISSPKKIQINEENVWEITYKYSVFVHDTDPDNMTLGRTYEYQKTIFLDANGVIVKETEKELLIEWQ